MQVLQSELDTAQKSNNKGRLEQLGQVVAAIQQASTPPGAELLQEMLDAPDDAAVDKLIDEHKEEINQDFVELLTGVMMQLQDKKNEELEAKVRAIYRKIVSISMRAQMDKN